MRWYVQAGFRGTGALMAMAVVWIYLTDPGMNGFYAAPFQESLHGLAFKPYVFRALVPWTVSAISYHVPDSIRFHVFDVAYHHSVALEAFRRMRMPPSVAVDLVVFTALSLAAAFAFYASVRRTCRRLYPGFELFGEIVPLVTLAGVQSLFSYTSYVYDMTTLMFSALCLELLVAERWVLFAVILVVAFFNKETFVLFIPAFALLAWRRLERRKFALIAGGTALSFLVSRIVLNAHFAASPGDFTAIQLTNHNQRLLHSYPVHAFLAWLLVFAFVFERWALKPRALRVVLGCLAPLVGACLVFGFFDELRDYYELYPVVMLLAAPAVARIMGVDVTPQRAT